MSALLGIGTKSVLKMLSSSVCEAVAVSPAAWLIWSSVASVSRKSPSKSLLSAPLKSPL
jgi:hypothetical protein